MYTVIFTFLDGKTFDVVVNEANIKRFIESVSKNETYWEEGNAIWLSSSQLRYFTILKAEPKVTEPIISDE